MRTLVVNQRKGGMGKTLVSLHLSVQAEMAGDGPVAIIDLDPSLSLTLWYRARQASTPILIEPLPTLKKAMEKAKRAGIKLLIIDTANSVGPEVIEAVASADLVLVPTQASPPDLRAVGATVSMLLRARKPMVFLINRVKPRVRLTGEAAIMLSQHGTVAPVHWHDRTDYGGAQVDGRTIQELQPNGAGAAEVTALWRYLKNRMEAPDEASDAV
jgi:chromosome partitioning protein